MAKVVATKQESMETKPRARSQIVSDRPSRSEAEDAVRTLILWAAHCRCLDSVLKPFGVAVVVEAAHQCMTTRGGHKLGVTMVTGQMLGVFRKRLETRHEFLSAINLRGALPL
jgi:hypothetical protein